MQESPWESIVLLCPHILVDNNVVDYAMYIKTIIDKLEYCTLLVVLSYRTLKASSKNAWRSVSQFQFQFL